uniref:TIM-barrel domain-containing protein n=1 Tax=Clostridium sp. NkU-1 TaxID=1095009 RepID=UPI000B2A66AC
MVDSDGGYPYTNSRDKKMEFYYGGTPVEGRRYEKNNVEYYILLGEPKEIMKGYSRITGTSPMLPKWAQGFSNFEWGINEQEMMEMIDTYRAKNIPLDSYAFDYDWKLYGQDNYGEFKWNTGNFPSAGSGALKKHHGRKGSENDRHYQAPDCNKDFRRYNNRPGAGRGQ